MLSKTLRQWFGSPRLALWTVVILAAILTAQGGLSSTRVPTAATLRLSHGESLSPVVASSARLRAGTPAATPSLSVALPSGMAYALDDEHTIPFVGFDIMSSQQTVFTGDPYSGAASVALGTMSPFSFTTHVLNYTSGTNRTLNITGGFGVGAIVPGSLLPLTVNGSVFLTALDGNPGGGNTYVYSGKDIATPITGVLDYPEFRNESAVNLVVPVTGLGYTDGQSLLVTGAWTLDGSVVLGEADVSAYPSSPPQARYLYRADLDTPAYANSSRPSNIVPVAQINWSAPLGWGHYYQVSPSLILNVPWAPATNRWTLFDLVNDTWQNYSVPGWDIVWSGHAGDALYLLVRTAWLNGDYSYVLDRLNLTGLTNLTAIPSLPVTPILNASFSNPITNFYVYPYVSGDGLYLFTGTLGYEPAFGPALYGVSAYNWSSGQLLFNQTFGLALPPPSLLWGAAYPAAAIPSPGVLPLFGSVFPDLSRGRLVVLSATALQATVDEEAGMPPCASCQYSFWVTDLNSTVIRVAGIRQDGVNRTTRLFSARALIGYQAPIASFTVTPSAGNTSTPFAVDASAVSSPYESSSSLQVRWDWEHDGTWDTAWTTLKTAQHRYSADGPYTIALEVRDGQGAVNETTRSLLVDDTPPTTVATLSGTRGSGGWYISAVVVNLVASDPLDGVASIGVRVDNGSWSTTPGGTATVALRDGRHFLEYNATDRTGNREPVRTLVVLVDTVPPAVAANLSGNLGSSGWYTSSVVVNLSASDATSGVAGLRFQLDGGPWQPYSGPVTVQGDGTHDLRYTATDGAGLASPTVDRILRIDGTPPELTILEPSGTVTTSAVTIRWNGSDATSGLASFAVSVDGAAPVSVGLRSDWTVNLTDGAHTVTVRATDAAGNVRTASVSFTVDTNPFSLSGPYRGLPTYVLIAAAAVGVVLAIYLRRRKKGSPMPPSKPEQPPEG